MVGACVLEPGFGMGGRLVRKGGDLQQDPLGPLSRWYAVPKDNEILEPHEHKFAPLTAEVLFDAKRWSG